MNGISRREFGTLIGAAAVTGGGVAPGTIRQAPARTSLTAGDIVERIRANVGVDWKSETVDGVKAGDLATPVTGVVTGVATLAVLQQAVALGANFVITGQPTFYSRSDARTPATGRGGAATPAAPDAVFAAKNTFVDANRLVVFRLSDHWRLRKPDPLVTGLANALGWANRQAAGDAARLVIPSVTLGALARRAKADLGIRGGMRVIGDPKAAIRRVGLLPGSTPIQASLAMLPSVDVIVAGEVREWESVEYVRDTAFLEKKGVILLGRVVSEDPGMRACTTWLQTLIGEVRVRHVSVGDPYWRPA